MTDNSALSKAYYELVQLFEPARAGELASASVNVTGDGQENKRINERDPTMELSSPAHQQRQAQPIGSSQGTVPSSEAPAAPEVGNQTGKGSDSTRKETSSEEEIEKQKPHHFDPWTATPGYLRELAKKDGGLGLLDFALELQHEYRRLEVRIQEKDLETLAQKEAHQAQLEAKTETVFVLQRQVQSQSDVIEKCIESLDLHRQ